MPPAVTDNSQARPLSDEEKRALRDLMARENAWATPATRIGEPYEALINLSVPRRGDKDRQTDLVMTGETVYLLLKRGRSLGYYEKSEITRDELTGLMAGGAELEQLSHEMEGEGGEAANIGHLLEEEVADLGISHSTEPGRHAGPSDD